jgi:hypothetical protein
VKEFVNEKAPRDNTDSLYKDLDKLTTLFKIHITSKLVPNLNKPGYEDAPAQQQYVENGGGERAMEGRNREEEIEK